VTVFTPPPVVALTAPGLCHNLPLDGHPAAGDASLLNGRPVIALYLGTVAGRRVELDITTLAELDELAAEVRLARDRLSMWVADHDVHPFGSAA
jgi:hypothetical protein